MNLTLVRQCNTSQRGKSFVSVPPNVDKHNAGVIASLILPLNNNKKEVLMFVNGKSSL